MGDAPAIHEALGPLAFLLGAWAGTGAGEYPTITPFAYHERIAFTHVGKPFLAYTQRTWAADDGRPLHAESGYLRHTGDGAVELVLAHPIGIVEVYAGHVSATSLRLATTTVDTTPTARRVDALERDIDVDGDQLSYAVRMAAVGLPLTHHLAATLRRA